MALRIPGPCRKYASRALALNRTGSLRVGLWRLSIFGNPSLASSVCSFRAPAAIGLRYFASESQEPSETEAKKTKKVAESIPKKGWLANKELLDHLRFQVEKMQAARKAEKKKHSTLTQINKTWITFRDDPEQRRNMIKKLKKICIDGLKHTYTGFKLLYANTKTTVKYLNKLASGKSLTRRERKLLALTSADLLRFIPFSFFVIIPGAEILLPIFLKVFPGMLPSTFAEESEEAKKYKKALPARFALTIELRAIVKRRVSKEIFNSEVIQACVRDHKVTKEQIREAYKLVDTALDLDRLSRSQLQSVAKHMMVPMSIVQYTSNAVITNRLISTLWEIRRDDQVIYAEGGPSNLTEEELRAAVWKRGMRAFGVSVPNLRRQLQDWIDLSLDLSFPKHLLIFFRPKAETLSETLLSIPENVVDQVIDGKYIKQDIQRELQKLMQMPEEDVKEIQGLFVGEDESTQLYFKQTDDLKAAMDNTSKTESNVLDITPAYGDPDAQVVREKDSDDCDEYDISKKAVAGLSRAHPIGSIERSSAYVVHAVEDTVEELEEDMEEDIEEMQKRLDKIRETEHEIELEERNADNAHPIEAIERSSHYQ